MNNWTDARVNEGVKERVNVRGLVSTWAEVAGEWRLPATLPAFRPRVQSLQGGGGAQRGPQGGRQEAVCTRPVRAWAPALLPSDGRTLATPLLPAGLKGCPLGVAPGAPCHGVGGRPLGGSWAGPVSSERPRGFTGSGGVFSGPSARWDLGPVVPPPKGRATEPSPVPR